MPAMPKSMERELLKKDPNADPQEVWAKVADELRRDEGNRPMRITYRADGSALMEGGLMGHPFSDAHSWELVSSTANEITINTWTATRPEKERQTFTFEEPNKLTYADGLNRGMSLIRVE